MPNIKIQRTTAEIDVFCVYLPTADLGVGRPQRQEENMEFICAQRVFLPLHVQGSYEDTYQASTSLHTV
jgi:hypothetical protein